MNPHRRKMPTEPSPSAWLVRARRTSQQTAPRDGADSKAKALVLALCNALRGGVDVRPVRFGEGSNPHVGGSHTVECTPVFGNARAFAGSCRKEGLGWPDMPGRRSKGSLQTARRKALQASAAASRRHGSARQISRRGTRALARVLHSNLAGPRETPRSGKPAPVGPRRQRTRVVEGVRPSPIFSWLAADGLQCLHCRHCRKRKRVARRPREGPRTIPMRARIGRSRVVPVRRI